MKTWDKAVVPALMSNGAGGDPTGPDIIGDFPSAGDDAAPPTHMGHVPKGITIYPLIAAPPLALGALKVTVAWALPAMAATPVGALGAVAVAPVTVSTTIAEVLGAELASPLKMAVKLCVPAVVKVVLN